MSALPAAQPVEAADAELMADLAAHLRGASASQFLDAALHGLSPSEVRMVDEAGIRAVMDAEEQRVRDSSRLIYERAYRRAVDARDAVRRLIGEGVPAFVFMPDGGTSGADGMKRLKLTEAIRTYATESRLLWDAAQMVCDVEELADDGESDGIKWHAQL